MHASIDAHDTSSTTALPVLPRVMSITCGVAMIATLGVCAVQPPDLFGVPLHVGAGVLSLALAPPGLYAALLWFGARRTARLLEQTPKPANSPRRRVLDGCEVRRPLTSRLGVLATLCAGFHAVAATNPTRRIEDKVAFLRRVALRCLAAAIVLAGISTAMLLAA
jgi:hypothetical protein